MSDKFDLLLLGAGHTHLGVLRLWSREQRHPWRIALISESRHAWYSGMLPGLLAGRYRQEQCRIPLQGICTAADVMLLTEPVVGLDPSINSVTLRDGRQVSGSWLSLNLGSQPAAPKGASQQMELLPVRPFAAFVERWSQWRLSPRPLAILGGGAAGVELALALAPQVPALTLLSAGPILVGHPVSLRLRALRHLSEAGVTVREDIAVTAIHGDTLVTGENVVWCGERAILATGASPLPWLRKTGLACDERGFIRIGTTLQSLSHPTVFASGDCASLANTPHSGVYAVRQGPTLASNLSAALRGQPFQYFVPQRHALALLADGHGGALMSWASVTSEGTLLGRLKDRLDRGFIKRHAAKN